MLGKRDLEMRAVQRDEDIVPVDGKTFVSR